MSKPQLKPTKLIPALVRYSQRRRAAMLRSSLSHKDKTHHGGGRAQREDVPPSVSSSSPFSVPGMVRGSGGGAFSARAEAGEEDLAIKYLEFCVNELKLKVRRGDGDGGPMSCTAVVEWP